MSCPARARAMRGVFTLLALLSVGFPTAPGAQELDAPQRLEQAKVHYEAGSRLYSQGRYEEAIRQLQQAYDLSGEATLLYNIAKSHEKLGRFDDAIRQYQEYVTLSPSLAPADRAEVERTIQDLLRRKQELLPELVIRSTPPGADIFFDDKTTLKGQTPNKFRVDPGPHKIYLEKKGFEPLEREFVMPTGKPLVLEFALKAEEEYGNVQIVANVVGARIFIDGKNVGITPYSEMPSLKIGFHQVILEKEGYRRWEQRVEVNKVRTTLVTADLVLLERPSSAPAVLGWTSLVLGGLLVGGGVAANYFAEQQFNDTELFKTLHNAELGGFVGGGVLLTLATTLIIYDLVRDDPTATQAAGPSHLVAAHRDGTSTRPLFGFGLDPRGGLQVGAGFAF